MTRRREIYLQYDGSWKKIFDPRTHVIYPFCEYTSFNRFQWVYGKNNRAKGHVYYDPLICNYCGHQEDPNIGGYYRGAVVFLSADDVRYSCGCNHEELSQLPDWFDQKYGYHQPFKFPEKFKGSIDHELAWRFSGNDYGLNRFVGKPFTEKELHEIYPRGFGSGGSSPRGVFTGWIGYDRYKVWMEDRQTFKVVRKWTFKEIARLIDEIINHAEVEHKEQAKQLELF